RSSEQPVEQNAERASQRELVSNRLGELEHLQQLRGGLPSTDASTRAPSRQAPGAPAVRPQTFGHGATRKPGKLSELRDSKLLKLLSLPCLKREQGQRKRREELARVLVRDDQHLPGARDICGRQCSEAPVRCAHTGVPPGADGLEG